jgi:ribosome-dependent ATPase
MCRACTRAGWRAWRERGIALRRRPGWRIETRFRYNPDVKSLPAMVPAVIPMLLLMIPAMLTALAVVREKELGSIINLYVTPVTRLRIPAGQAAALRRAGDAQLSADVRCWRSPCSACPSRAASGRWRWRAAVYVHVSTGIGLLASTFTRSQIAAMFFAMIGTMMPAVQFSGLLNPVSSLEGCGPLIGEDLSGHAHAHHQPGRVQQGAGPADLAVRSGPLLIAVPVILALAIALLKKAGALNMRLHPPPTSRAWASRSCGACGATR